MIKQYQAKRAIQFGFSIPAAIFILVLVSLLGTAMISILNQGQQSIAREVISIRALMAAESGAERSLHIVLEDSPASCTGNLSNPPTSFNALLSDWNPILLNKLNLTVLSVARRNLNLLQKNQQRKLLPQQPHLIINF